MSDTLVTVENISKKFCRDLKRGLWYGVRDMASEIFGGSNAKTLLRDKEFWAVRDISFELKRGECLGLIGHNGAGKSTLLKMLNGLIKPDCGKIQMRGRVGALIELGAGFNPILTGRENIYINGSLLGFDKGEIETKMPSIIEFAAIGDFLDTPVQYYSSGMKVRLGFAVAAQMEPDVLIIDEVLAVGDLDFRIKCLTKIGDLMARTAVIFVSHSMPQVSLICNKLILMERGRSLMNSDDVSLGIETYFKGLSANGKIIGGNLKVRPLSVNICQHGVDRRKAHYCELSYGEPFEIFLKVEAATEATKYWINLSFIDRDGKSVANIFSYYANKKVFEQKGCVNIKISVDKFLLALGSYALSVAINEVTENGRRGEIYYYDSNIVNVVSKNIGTANAPVLFTATWEVI